MEKSPQYAEPSGVLIVNKHAGVTSHDIVNKIRRLYGTRRVGHTGTLDPMATGVLVVLIGRAAKAAEYLSADTKRYRAKIRFGITTDSEDITGNVLSESGMIPTEAEIRAVLPRFCGKIEQIPPMYSALKIGGRKLVDLARRGETVERAPREITVFDLQLTPTDAPETYELDVTCSGGTYIRTLCADLGAALGCGAVMSALERTATGGFRIADAHTTEELESMEPDERMDLLMPVESLFADLPSLSLAPFFEHLARNGCELYLSKLKVSMELGQRVRLCDEAGGFFALGEVTAYEAGNAIKTIKLFSLE